MNHLQDADGVYHQPPVHAFFGLSYSSYFVMPRSALQVLPLDWQNRFVALMNEAEEFGLETPDYKVLRSDAPYTLVTKYDIEDEGSRDYEFTALLEDPWADYRHPDISLLPLSLRPTLSEPPTGNSDMARYGSFRTPVTEE